MTALMEQHEAWKAARDRLRGPKPKKAIRVPPRPDYAPVLTGDHHRDAVAVILAQFKESRITMHSIAKTHGVDKRSIKRLQAGNSCMAETLFALADAVGLKITVGPK